MITYKIHLIRTGSTFEGDWKHYVGQNNLPLCDKGIAALENLRAACEYPRVDVMFTSPLDRCVQTGEILYHDTYAVIHEGLCDLDLGDFTGCSPDELRGNPDFELWMQNSVENPPPNGEKAEDFTARVLFAVNEIFAQMMKERMTNAAVITHVGVIMTILTAIGLPKRPLHEWSVQNGCGYTLLMTPQMWMRDRACEVYAHIPTPPDAELY